MKFVSGEAKKGFFFSINVIIDFERDSNQRQSSKGIVLHLSTTLINVVKALQFVVKDLMNFFFAEQNINSINITTSFLNVSNK